MIEWNSPQSFAEVIFGKKVNADKILHYGEASSYRFNITKDIGSGFIEIINIAKGLSVLILNCRALRTYSYQIKNSNWIRLNFSLEHEVTVNFGSEKKLDDSIPVWRLINPKDKVSVYEMPADARSVWVTLAFTEEYLLNFLQSSTLLESTTLKQLLTKTAKEAIFKEFPLDHQLSLVASNLLSINVHDALHLPYALAKVNELMALSIERILLSAKEPSIPIKLRPCDEAAIKLAHEIILKNLAQVPSLKELCLMVGMNRNKLHYGFKYLFNMSLTQLVNEERLNSAYNLLVNSNLPLTDIAYEVGFRHQSSFSTRFKKKYGFSPKQLRIRAQTRTF